MKNKLSDELIHFIDQNPTPFHVVENTKKKLALAGFEELTFSKTWVLEKAHSYFLTYGDTTIIAFKTPKEIKNSAFAIIGAHTDSPNLRVKQGYEKHTNGYMQTPVEVYGGVIINSWVDRDLAIAGRVHFKEANTITYRLFFINKPIARISQPAIHLNREVNEKGLILNNETELTPDFGVSDENRPNFLKELIANELKIKMEDILSYEVAFANHQAGSYGGYQDDFIHSARLDNQAMCHAGLSALLASTYTNNIQMLALFDHEEVGSRSALGADSSILQNLTTRIASLLQISIDECSKMTPHSFIISADMAHAIHSNFPNKHGNIYPKLNKGPVLKINSSQRYSTDGSSLARIKNLAIKNNIPYQMYYHRSDLTCGSTIGPAVSSGLTFSTIDLGTPMLSMHSSRETCGSEDHPQIVKLFTCFYNDFLEPIKA